MTDKKTVSTGELVDALKTKHDDLPKKKIKEIMGDLLSEIETRLAREGNDVRLEGIGTLSRKETPARKGRNPQTGAVIDIAAGKKFVYRPSKALKDLANKTEQV